MLAVQLLLPLFVAVAHAATVTNEARHRPTCSGGAAINITFHAATGGRKLVSYLCPLSVAQIESTQAEISEQILGNIFKRTHNTCGRMCDTYCAMAVGGGPDPNDCSAIASFLYHNGHNSILSSGFSQVFATGTCQVLLSNFYDDDLAVCADDLGQITNYIARTCHAENAPGGYCLMGGTWNVGAVTVQSP